MHDHLVLVIDDEESFRKLYSQALAELNVKSLTAASSEEALNILKDTLPDMIISDIRMPGLDGLSLLCKVKETNPGIPFLLITAYPNVRDAVNSLKFGAVDYLEKPVDLDEFKIVVGETLHINSTFKVEFPRDSLAGIIVESHSMQNLFNDAYRIAGSDVTTLITGESGTGKEILSLFIHNNSTRADKPIVTLNCASLPSNILNSELFGHERGAFTGAVSSRLGKFREADGGTLFLDEIGDMPLELQSSLLRAIEYKKICPVGNDREIKVNVRLIAATNKNLESEICAGRFRRDLFYRLNVITLDVPPLRERRDDIIPLARHFLKLSGGQNKRLSANTIRILKSYNWPGNVRELVNAIKRAYVLSRTELIMPEHLPPDIKNSINEPGMRPSDEGNKILTFEQNEVTSINNALKATKGNQTKAAILLGISRRTLINKIKKYRIVQYY